MLSKAFLFLVLGISTASALTIEKTKMPVHKTDLVQDTTGDKTAMIDIPVTIVWPDNVKEKIPAMVFLQGSGGLNLPHKMVYAREFARMGVATVIVDSFSARGIKSVVKNQSLLSSWSMAQDAIDVLQTLAKNPKIQADKVGVMGNSKGGAAAMKAAIRHMNKPRKVQFALFIPLYPSCTEFWYDPHTINKPIHIIAGAKDTYTNPQYCIELTEILKKNGSDITDVTIPNAMHGWDVPGNKHWSMSGENWAKCKLVEVKPHIWFEATSNIQTNDINGQTKDRQKALSSCMTDTASGGFNNEAAQNSMALIKDYISTTLK